MDTHLVTFAPVSPDLSPVAAALPPERVFSEPGRLSAVVLDMLEWTAGDAETVATCAGIYQSDTIALLATQIARRVARVRREVEAALAEGTRHA
jgi:hypothetical protein